MTARSPIAALVAISLALTGCTVLGPDYQRPATDLPNTYSDAGSADPQAPVQAAWWTLFGDPALNDLMAQALAGNLDLQAALARVEEAEAALRETGAALVPSVDLGGEASRSRSSSKSAVFNSAMPIYRTAHSLGLSTAFELDVWGRLRRAKESATAQAQASRYAHDAVRLSLAGMVANTYLALRALDAELAVSRDTLASREASQAIVTTRVQAGLAGSLDQRQAEGAVAASRAQITSLRLQRAQTEHQLALLAGRPDLKLAPAGLERLPLPLVPPAGLPSSLLDARPDLRQAEALLAASNAQIGVARAALYPTLSLTGALGAESKDLSSLFSAGARTWNLGAGLLLPIFDAGANQARLDQATARQKQALVQYQKTVQTAFQEVNDALVALREHAEGEAAQQARVSAETQALDLARARYEAGYSGYLEVLDAQRSLYVARLAFVATRQARLAAAVDLFKALGGGWRE
jgi:multidrug efflux system outer membrane protein